MLFQLAIPLGFVGSTYREVRQALIDMTAMFQLSDTSPRVRRRFYCYFFPARTSSGVVKLRSHRTTSFIFLSFFTYLSSFLCLFLLYRNVRNIILGFFERVKETRKRHFTRFCVFLRRRFFAKTRGRICSERAVATHKTGVVCNQIRVRGL